MWSDFEGHNFIRSVWHVSWCWRTPFCYISVKCELMLEDTTLLCQCELWVDVGGHHFVMSVWNVSWCWTPVCYYKCEIWIDVGGHQFITLSMKCQLVLQDTSLLCQVWNVSWCWGTQLLTAYWAPCWHHITVATSVWEQHTLEYSMCSQPWNTMGEPEQGKCSSTKRSILPPSFVQENVVNRIFLDWFINYLLQSKYRYLKRDMVYILKFVVSMSNTN